MRTEYITKMKEEKNLRRTQLLDAQLSQPLTLVDRLLKGLALDNTSSEAASKGITGAVGVVDKALLDLEHGVLLDLVLALHRHERGLGAVGDDGHALALGVGLGQVGHELGDFLQVLGGVALRLGPRRGLVLVADHVVPVRRAGVERLLEELRDEGRGQRQDEDLVLGCGFFAERLDCGGADWWPGVILVLAFTRPRLLGLLREDEERTKNAKVLPVKW